MKTTIIIQARMASSRFPGKILKKIQNNTIIELIVKRLKKAKLANDIVVATSNNKENKPLIEHLKKKKIKFFCGSEKDALSRFYLVAKKNKSKIIVRITGDCPLADPNIVDEFILDYKKNNFDYLSNANPWTYPDGLDVEVFKRQLILDAQSECTNSFDREHVTTWIRNNKRYKIGELFYSENLSFLRLSVYSLIHFFIVVDCSKISLDIKFL